MCIMRIMRIMCMLVLCRMSALRAAPMSNHQCCGAAHRGERWTRQHVHALLVQSERPPCSTHVKSSVLWRSPQGREVDAPTCARSSYAERAPSVQHPCHIISAVAQPWGERWTRPLCKPGPPKPTIAAQVCTPITFKSHASLRPDQPRKPCKPAP